MPTVCGAKLAVASALRVIASITHDIERHVRTAVTREAPAGMIVAAGSGMSRLLILVMLALPLLDCERRADPSEQKGATGAATNALLERVMPANVCMANNRYMPERQTPVVVDDKTYYGCCPMCERRLRDDSSTRTATDPVSGDPVDKALAVIGKLRDGRVLYFESEQTFAGYRGARHREQAAQPHGSSIALPLRRAH